MIWNSCGLLFLMAVTPGTTAFFLSPYLNEDKTISKAQTYPHLVGNLLSFHAHTDKKEIIGNRWYRRLKGNRKQKQNGITFWKDKQNEIQNNEATIKGDHDTTEYFNLSGEETKASAELSAQDTLSFESFVPTIAPNPSNSTSRSTSNSTSHSTSNSTSHSTSNSTSHLTSNSTPEPTPKPTPKPSSMPTFSPTETPTEATTETTTYIPTETPTIHPSVKALDSFDTVSIQLGIGLSKGMVDDDDNDDGGNNDGDDDDGHDDGDDDDDGVTTKDFHQDVANALLKTTSRFICEDTDFDVFGTISETDLHNICLDFHLNDFEMSWKLVTVDQNFNFDVSKIYGDYVDHEKTSLLMDYRDSVKNVTEVTSLELPDLRTYAISLEFRILSFGRNIMEATSLSKGDSKDVPARLLEEFMKIILFRHILDGSFLEYVRNQNVDIKAVSVVDDDGEFLEFDRVNSSGIMKPEIKKTSSSDGIRVAGAVMMLAWVGIVVAMWVNFKYRRLIESQVAANENIDLLYQDKMKATSMLSDKYPLQTSGHGVGLGSEEGVSKMLQRSSNNIHYP